MLNLSSALSCVTMPQQVTYGKFKPSQWKAFCWTAVALVSTALPLPNATSHYRNSFSFAASWVERVCTCSANSKTSWSTLGGHFLRIRLLILCHWPFEYVNAVVYDYFDYNQILRDVTWLHGILSMHGRICPASWSQDLERLECELITFLLFCSTSGGMIPHGKQSPIVGLRVDFEIIS
jgi:hypothetical protein